jgi:phosphoglycerate kinase
MAVSVPIARFQTPADLDARELAGRVVALRIDGSVPPDAAQEVADNKLEPALATLRLLTAANARVLLLSHVNADGSDADRQQGDVCHRLSVLFGRPIRLLHQCRGAEVRQAIGRLRDGEVLMLGNLAIDPAEQENEPEFARFLADLCDVYCDEAFSLAHEVRASTVGAASMARMAVAGVEFERACEILNAVLGRPTRPFLAALGGSLSIDRLLLLESIASRADVILLGGEICLPFLKAAGRSTGAAAVADEAVAIAHRIMDDANTWGRFLFTPRDFVTVDITDRELAGKPLRDGNRPSAMRYTDADSLGLTDLPADIGPDTRHSWAEQLGSARTVLWHGPLGICESPPLAEGTLFFAREIIARTWPGLHRTVICGELLTAALRGTDFPRDRVDYFSPAGIAILHYAASRPLPAIEALRLRSHRKRSPKVVLALSGADEDRRLADFAASWFPDTAAIHCIHVERGLDEDSYPDVYLARTKKELLTESRHAEQIFDRVEAVLAGYGLAPAERTVLHGNPTERLIRRARELSADVIVTPKTNDIEEIAAEFRVLVLPDDA